MYGCMDVWMYGYMDGWMYGCMDVWIYGWMDVRTHMYVWMYEYIYMDGWMDVCVFNTLIYPRNNPPPLVEEKRIKTIEVFSLTSNVVLPPTKVSFGSFPHPIPMLFHSHLTLVLHVTCCQLACLILFPLGP